MTSVGRGVEWIRFLEVRVAEDGVSDLRRMCRQLDDACDLVQGVLTALSGCPSPDVEEVLRVARTATQEANGLLGAAIIRLRLDGPEAA